MNTLFPEDSAVDTFLASSFGFFVMTLFQGILTAPSWQTFTYLACGWALARDRHTITTYLWLTGATAVKHFSRFYVFLGCPLDDRRWPLTLGHRHPPGRPFCPRRRGHSGHL